MRHSGNTNSSSGSTNTPAPTAADRGPWCDYCGRDGYCRDFNGRRTTDNLRKMHYGDWKALWFCPTHWDFREDFRPASIEDFRKAWGWIAASMAKLDAKPAPRTFNPGEPPSAPLPERAR